MVPLTRIRQQLIASDPGHTRLVDAGAATATMLVAILAAWGVISVTHGSSSLLVTAGIVAVIPFGGTHDATPFSRWVTSMLIIVPVLAATVTAHALADHRTAAAGVFVAIAGVGTWARRFGVRGSTLGVAGFFAYMLVLLAADGDQRLGEICLVVVAAWLAGVLVRTVLLMERPQRRFRLLVTQFRSACAVAVHELWHTPNDDPHTYLRRISTVVLAIDEWTTEFDAADIGIDIAALWRAVFDAETDTELLCREVSARRSVSRVAAEQDSTVADSLITALVTLLTIEPGADDRRRATDLARRAIEIEDQTGANKTGADRISPDGLVTLLAARAIIAQVALLDLTEQRPPRSTVTDTPDRDGAAVNSEADVHDGAAAQHDSRPRLTERPSARSGEPNGRRSSRLLPTTRMAIQVTIAAALAAVVGEAISASRWYWAVLTTFLVFLGSSTRGSILTKSYRRILGTAVGIVIGAGLAIAIVHQPLIQITLCLVCVFCAYYFGPLNVAILAMFFTLMLASIYDLLGILTWSLALARLTETAAGAVIGVLCAYLILSTSCRDTVVEKVDDYFEALDDVLGAAVDAATTGGPDGRERVVAAIRALDATAQHVRTAFDDMAAVMVVGVGRRHLARALTLHRVTGDAHRLAHSVVAVVADAPAFVGADADRIRLAGDTLTRHADRVRRTFTDIDSGTADVEDVPVADTLRAVHAAPAGVRGAIVVALVRLDHTLDDLPAEADRGAEHPRLRRATRVVQQHLPRPL